MDSQLSQIIQVTAMHQHGIADLVYGLMAAAVVVIYALDQFDHPIARRADVFVFCLAVWLLRAIRFVLAPGLEPADALLYVALVLVFSRRTTVVGNPVMPRMTLRWRRRVDEAMARERQGRHGRPSVPGHDDTHGTF